MPERSNSGEGGGHGKKPSLIKWILKRTDWLAVLSCIPLAAGLILYCVPVSTAHGDTQDLINLANGGQSSLSWLATVYAVTLGITLPLTVVSIIYSLLLVAAAIYAHTHTSMYPEEPCTQRPWGRLPRGQQQAQEQPQPPPPQQQQQQYLRSLLQRALRPRWRKARAEQQEQQQGRQVEEQRSLAGSSPPPSVGSRRSGKGRSPAPLPRGPSASLLSANGVGAGPASAGPTSPSQGVTNLAQTLKQDKRQAAGLWERALGLVPGGPSVLNLMILSGGETPGPLGARKPEGPPAAAVVDITKLRSPGHRRLPSMSMTVGFRQGSASSPQGGMQRPQSSPLASNGIGLRWAPMLPGASGTNGGAGAGGSNGKAPRRAFRLATDDSALSDMEKDAPCGSACTAAGQRRTVRWPSSGSAQGRRWVRSASDQVRRAVLTPVATFWERRLSRGRSGQGSGERGQETAAGEGEGAGQGPNGLVPRHSSGASAEEQLRLQHQAAALKAYRALRWMLLTLISANTATLVWLIILLVATGAWLVCSQAVKEVALETYRLQATAMGSYAGALGMGPHNQAAVSTYAQLFGEAFLRTVNAASGGRFSFHSYPELEAVSGLGPDVLGAAAASAYNSTVTDLSVQGVVGPQFNPTGNTSGLPCPSTCLNFRYFAFLESAACVCDRQALMDAYNLAGSTVDQLSLSLAGLALMILSVVVLLLRFATYLGQVRARWAARPALQLYAAHKEEMALRRRMRGEAGRLYTF